ncbi:hypothetical protein BKA63DRAFT_561871 [Paraphoma chrysanthemicola]|nr:hypothetical protein BKA63DRAFT_561871 [Paraphoma chrysanthemicola]
MAGPPASSEQSAHVPSLMDGLIHNLSRQKRATYLSFDGQASRDHGARVMSASTQADQPSGSITRPRDRSSDQHSPLKGILKAPKVHFDEYVEEEQSVLEEQLPRPPPFHFFPTSEPTGTATVSDISPPPLLLPVPAPPSPPPAPTSASRVPFDLPPVEGPRPPSLFNRRIEADEYLSEAAYILYTKFFDELAEFVQFQGEVVRKRVEVQEKRKELANLRDLVSRRDMDFITHVRVSTINGVLAHDSKLDGLFEACQQARDVLGPVEAEYEPLEVDLGAGEYKLKEKYADIEARFEQFFKLKTTSTTRMSNQSGIEYEDSTIPSTSNEEDGTTRPNTAALFQGAHIGDEVNIGQLPIQTSAQLDLTTAAMFSNRFEPPGARFGAVRVLDDLQGGGLTSGNLRNSSPSRDSLYYLSSSASSSSVDDGEIALTLRGVASHIVVQPPPDDELLIDITNQDSFMDDCHALLLRCADLEGVVDSNNSGDDIFQLQDYLITFKDTRDRVNRWLLHQLRISPRETYALRRQVLALEPECQQWAQYVTLEWAHDMLGHFDASIEYESEDEIHAQDIQSGIQEVRVMPSITADAYHGLRGSTSFPIHRSLIMEPAPLMRGSSHVLPARRVTIEYDSS